MSPQAAAAAAAAPSGVVTFYRLVEEAPPPARADRSGLGSLPTRAYRHCDAVTTAAGYGWHIRPPMGFELLWDGEAVWWRAEEVPELADWMPLGAVQFPHFAARFDAAAPEAARGYAPTFLTVLQEPGGYLGGYLVTNLWGRPLEFRLSTAVQPNRVQQILYAHTLTGYVCGELIGKTLFDKTGTPAQVVLTDTFDALSLRHAADVPVVWVAPPGDPRAADLAERGVTVRPAAAGRAPLLAHPDCPDDVPRLRELFERLSGLDVVEPFARIRDAIAEARKMGVAQRAAG
jgi:hypothetical protein